MAATSSLGKRTGDEDSSSTRRKVIKFRNYNPQNEDLKGNKMKRTLPDSIDEQVSEQVQSGEQSHVQEVNLSNLAPKKPDWDLKRDISKKLETLERQTQRAIIDLIRERLKDNSEDLASAVASVQEQQGDEDNDDD